MTRLTYSAMVVFLMTTYFWPDRQSGSDQRALPSRLNYEAHDISALDALIRLGEVYDRPIGIVSGNQKIATNKISMQVRQTTAREALVALMQQLPAYEWAEDNGVFVVRPHLIPPITKRMLSIVIPRISTQNTDIDGLSFRLWMEVQLQVDPDRRGKGFAGFGHLGNYFELGPMDLTNVRCDELLTEIVRRRNSAAWVVLPPPETLKGVPRERLWGIVTYANPPQPLDQLCCLNPEYFK
jgi:hypothetical protein